MEGGFLRGEKALSGARHEQGELHVKSHVYEFYAVDQQDDGVNFEVIRTSISANQSPPTPVPSRIGMRLELWTLLA